MSEKSSTKIDDTKKKAVLEKCRKDAEEIRNRQETNLYLQ
jgi:hypothetical protein